MKYIFPLPHERTHATETQTNLLERNETGRVGGTDTRPSVLDGLAAKPLAQTPIIQRQTYAGKDPV